MSKHHYPLRNLRDDDEIFFNCIAVKLILGFFSRLIVHELISHSTYMRLAFFLLSSALNKLFYFVFYGLPIFLSILGLREHTSTIQPQYIPGVGLSVSYRAIPQRVHTQASLNTLPI